MTRHTRRLPGRFPLTLIRSRARTETFLAFLPAPGTGVLTAVAIRFTDQFPSFREVDGLSDTAFRLHVSAFFWCSINRTDGLIRREDLGLVCARVRASERFAAECERRGAWHDARHDCGSEHCAGPVDADGWVVHDYLKENPSRADLEAEEAGKSRGGKWGNHKRWHADKGKMAPGCEFCETAKPRRSPGGKPPPNRTSHNRSHTDRISDSGATPIDRSDFDFDLDQSPGVSQVSRSSVSNARAHEDPAVIAAVIKAIASKVERIISAAEAERVIAKIRARPKTPKKIHDPVKYFTVAIENEEDLFAELLCDPAEVLEAALPEPDPNRPDTERHPYERDPRTGVCKCDRPRSNWRHEPQEEAIPA